VQCFKQCLPGDMLLFVCLCDPVLYVRLAQAEMYPPVQLEQVWTLAKSASGA